MFESKRGIAVSLSWRQYTATLTIAGDVMAQKSKSTAVRSGAKTFAGISYSIVRYVNPNTHVAQANGFVRDRSHVYDLTGNIQLNGNTVCSDLFQFGENFPIHSDVER